ncbi:class I SAM-dependent methyltransferase [Roseomonas elaeocarpi]|uniref:Methyltransferase n=1 Tax=Roseomonas elaeocarpi TaxID=907779 RepID=A0ABV6K0C8_9PROT
MSRDEPGTGTAAHGPAPAPRDAAADERFVRDHTVLARPPLVPEIELHLATEITPIWQATERWLAQEGIEPPFWAFAWPGSQALARLVLDEPARVRGRRVLDFAAGGGLAAIACHRAGATVVEAAELDPLACAATRLNARHNGAPVRDICGDVVGEGLRGAPRDSSGEALRRWDVVLAGDVCYEAPMTGHILPWLRRLAGEGVEVWVADPGRAYLPREGMEAGPRFLVPTTRELEDRDQREVTVWRLRP